MTLTDYEQDIVANVAKYGCHITSVFGDEDEPPFTYSVGLWETVGGADVTISRTRPTGFLQASSMF